MKEKKTKLITAADLTDVFNDFKNDKERIKYMKEAYKNMSIAKSFAVFYGEEISPEVKQDKSVNTVTVIEIGESYLGKVKEFSKNVLSFEIPGVKEELIAKENFNDCFDHVENYLLTHNNEMMFTVREKKNGKYYVSVIEAYYKAWKKEIDKGIQNEDAITVHIDKLVNGGYICKTDIWTINELTGKNYTNSVFIPGSHIVLNIEHDFESWVGEDVQIVPQKFVEYRRDYRTGEVDLSLVGSRKRVLQINGMVSMFNIYNRAQLGKMDNAKYTPEVFHGTVTGIINSNKKTGVFVELTNECITGLLPKNVSELVNYRPGQDIDVYVSEFEIQEGKEPFQTNKKGTKVLKCNVRPVFAEP
ncbi:MAG: hypothetical protein J6D03_00900 [Clostridia bacterium]|nr:hypothetical protein [Clostridia bacterium]